MVNLHLAKDLFARRNSEFRKRSALSVLAHMPEAKIARAYQTMVIGTTDPETAGLLRISLSAPVVFVRCNVLDDEGVAIYVAEITYRSDCLKLFVYTLKSFRWGGRGFEGVSVCRPEG